MLRGIQSKLVGSSSGKVYKVGNTWFASVCWIGVTNDEFTNMKDYLKIRVTWIEKDLVIAYKEEGQNWVVSENPKPSQVGTKYYRDTRGMDIGVAINCVQYEKKTRLSYEQFDKQVRGAYVTALEQEIRNVGL